MRWILFGVTLPWTVTVSWGWVIFMRIFAARDLRWEPGGVLTAVWRPWVTKPRKNGRPLWRWSTTLGRGIVYQPEARRPVPSGPPTGVELHEGVHVRQVEDLMFASLVVGAIVAAVTGNWLLGLVVWWSGGAWQAPAFVASGLRSGWTLEGVYAQSEHERSARAQTSRFAGAPSWLEREVNS